MRHREQHISSGRMMRTRIACLLVLLLVVGCSTSAAARSWRISDFRSIISVQQDGSSLVTERISLVFVGSFQGIHSTIPIDYPGANATNCTLFLKVVSVKGDSGEPLRY